MQGEETYELKVIELDKYTHIKANFPPILEPRWHDEKFIISANVKDHNRIVCTYVRPNGESMFPEPLYVSGKTARKYKSFPMALRNGGFMNMRAIPIKDFKILRISERSVHDIY